MITFLISLFLAFSLSFIRQCTGPLSIILVFLLHRMNFFVATLRELVVPRLLRRVTLFFFFVFLALMLHTIPKSLTRNKPYSHSLLDSYVFCASTPNNHKICTIVGIFLNDGCEPLRISNFVVNKNPMCAWGCLKEEKT